MINISKFNQVYFTCELINSTRPPQIIHEGFVRGSFDINYFLHCLTFNLKYEHLCVVLYWYCSFPVNILTFTFSNWAFLDIYYVSNSRKFQYYIKTEVFLREIKYFFSNSLMIFSYVFTSKFRKWCPSNINHHFIE